MGSHDTPRTLSKSPRRLRILAKAGSSQKITFPLCRSAGVRADQRFAGELFAGTSKTTTFYKGLTMPSRAWSNITFYKLFEHVADLL